VPIHVEQLEQDSVLHYRFSGNVTLHDLDTLYRVEESFFAALAEEQCFNVIADLSDLYTIEARLFAELQQMRMVRDDGVCVVVVVGANPYLRAMAISLGMLSGKHEFLFRDRLDDALNEFRATPSPGQGG
jgi:hypothetical protein